MKDRRWKKFKVYMCLWCDIERCENKTSAKGFVVIYECLLLQKLFFVFSSVSSVSVLLWEAETHRCLFSSGDNVLKDDICSGEVWKTCICTSHSCGMWEECGRDRVKILLELHHAHLSGSLTENKTGLFHFKFNAGNMKQTQLTDGGL